MFLIALDLIFLARAEIIHLTYCEYSDSSCTSEDLCVDVCEDTAYLCSSSSCAALASVYLDDGTREYGECFSNGGSYYLANCTDAEESSEESSEEESVCSDFDICEVYCQTNNGGCGAGCRFVGKYVTNSSDYSCTHMEQYFAAIYDEFESFDKCFNNTADYASGQDHYLICNMDVDILDNSGSKDVNSLNIAIPIASIAAVYCCMYIVWRQSQTAEEKFAAENSRGTTEPI